VEPLGCNVKLARLYCNVGQQVRASLCQLLWSEVRAYLVKIAHEPANMHSQVESPSGGGHPIAATQEGSHCLQHIPKPAQQHLLPRLQAHQGLVLRELADQGEAICQ